MSPDIGSSVEQSSMTFSVKRGFHCQRRLKIPHFAGLLRTCSKVDFFAQLPTCDLSLHSGKDLDTQSASLVADDIGRGLDWLQQ